MIGDDQVYSSLARAFGGSKGASAGIHADHQPNTGCRCALDHISAQVVAFTNAVRHVKICCAASQLNRCF
jgi:hypothetical protein